MLTLSAQSHCATVGTVLTRGAINELAEPITNDRRLMHLPNVLVLRLRRLAHGTAMT